MCDTILTFNQKSQNKLITNKREKYQTKTNNVIVMVNEKMRIYYDLRHKSFLFNLKNKLYLRLNKDYRLFNHNRKLS